MTSESLDTGAPAIDVAPSDPANAARNSLVINDLMV